MFPLFDLPPGAESSLEARLKNFSHSLTEPEKLSQSIRKLSNHFLKGENFGDYWSNRDFRAAYISYFATLNFVRARSVFAEARKLGFFEGIQSITDWGCGSGAALWAFLAEWREKDIPQLGAVDQSAGAIEEFKEWAKLFEVKATTQKQGLTEVEKTKSDTLILSYVLNEVESWPEIPKHVERLVLIEPSTHQAGRRLLQWRDEQLKTGEWFAWAPCTHQLMCPLLNQSGRDWCHHRVHWNKPQWFQDLEKYLPMRNDTLTLSYLLLSRNPPKINLEGVGRIVGDEQEEKRKNSTNVLSRA